MGGRDWFSKGVRLMAVTYQKALADVKARVGASRTSFHAGMAILPRERREAMYALYAFCRVVDDIADDSPTTAESLAGLEIWREHIHQLFLGAPSEAITAALVPALSRYGLVEADFQAIIDGMTMDAGTPLCAPDAKTLDLYCDRVASAVGRVSVRIFGDASPKAMDVAFHLGRAFQMTNILRDLAEDASRQRCYLPRELLIKHTIPLDNAEAILNHPHLRHACRDFAEETKKHFVAADQAMKSCIPSAMRPAKIMRAYYGAIFDKLVALDWNNPHVRVGLPRWQKFWLVLRHLLG
jgi:phytoene synthase